MTSTDPKKVVTDAFAAAGRKPIDPGIYFGMPEDQYRADPSLGSSDMKELARNPSTYWFDSWMNPNREAGNDDTPSKIRGTAVHVLVLYGEAEFDRRYMRGAVHTDDMTPAEKGAATKAANAAAAKYGKIALPAKVYDNVAIASAMIAKNPKLATALTGGLNEVSIFWRDAATGIPKKARLDCLKPRGIGDLKSLTNKYEKPFPQACIDSIRFYRYDVQAMHYLMARSQVAKFAADGAVYGDHDTDLFKAVAKSKEWAWQFVWWQAEGAPITYSKIISPKNPLLEISATTIRNADANYISYMAEFGPSEMWLLVEEPTELYVDDLGTWFGRDY